jgi:hypothetical protein
MLAIAAVTFAWPLVYPIQAQTKAEKYPVVSKYKDKFLVVKKEGLFLGLRNQYRCESVRLGRGPSAMIFEPVGNRIVDAAHSELSNPYGCDIDPIHKGEILKVYDARIFTMNKGPFKGVDRPRFRRSECFAAFDHSGHWSL